jgi:hypothetical protein
MPLYDLRCKDVARIVAAGPKTINDIGRRIHELYPDIDVTGTWIQQPLTEWNPFVEREDNRYKLSELGRALISLPGREGEEPTDSEKSFLIGTMMFDEKQRRAVAELILLGRSTEDEWIVTQTRSCLKKLGFLK